MYFSETCPWYLKAMIIGYDTISAFVHKHDILKKQQVQQNHEFLFVMFAFFVMYVNCMIWPSILASVTHRSLTNSLVSQTFIYLSIVSTCLLAYYKRFVTIQEICFFLQFTCCHCLFSLLKACNSNQHLLRGARLLRWGCILGIFTFPFAISHLFANGMHLSPYILAITFSGEIVGACTSLMFNLLNMILNFIMQINI